MSESNNILVSSFGDPPNAQPPTPRQTPTSAAFPSPVFETPKPPQGCFAEAGGLTPRFAEDYSVFNSTPGNLRGSQGTFADFVSAEHFGSSLGHKRLLSVEELAIQIASRENHTSANHNLPLPPVDPSRRLPSSPASSILPQGLGEVGGQQIANGTAKGKPAKKARRGTLQGNEPAQVLSPPPSAHKGGKKLAQKMNMQDDQSFGQPDFNDHLQPHEMAALMGNPNDMFTFPMSTSGPLQGHFWDPPPSMGMDIDFDPTGASYFQPSHRHTGSFDWNSDIQLFQDPVPPPHQIANQENVQPTRRERAIAPKPPAHGQASTGTVGGGGIVPSTFQGVGDPFGLTSPVDALDPGLLFSRPQSSAMDADFTGNGGANGAVVAHLSSAIAAPQPRRANSLRESKKGKGPDRSFSNSPLKASGRPGLERSFSENRGKKALGRALPTLAPATKAPQPAINHNLEQGKPLARPLSGRVSPLKAQRRLSSLASIPESVSQPQLSRPRTSVRFTIDAYGRARAETTIMDDTGGPSIMRSRSSRELSSRKNWDSSDDESSTDEDPIIIPSRQNSFNASFALPDPRKPVGSIFHPARRSISDRSASASAVSDGSGPHPNEVESEAETVLSSYEKGGDAASELRKVVEDRQKRSLQMETAKSQHFLAAHTGKFNGRTVSPVSLTDSSYGTDVHGVRCVCNQSEVERGNGFMIQCESCEMWLHGKCVNITRRTMPSVYICGFCANTGNGVHRRVHDSSRGSAIGQTSAAANKSFRAFR